MRKKDWPQELPCEQVYGNFRIPRQYKPGWTDEEEKGKGEARHFTMIRQQPCACCGADPREYKIDPHHLRGGRYAYTRGMGQKTPFTSVIPLCRDCHNEVETIPSRKQPDHFRDEHGLEAEMMACAYAGKRGLALEAYARVTLSFQLQRAEHVLKLQAQEKKSAAGRRPRAYHVRLRSD
jgi:hypothetical protein